MQRLDALQDTDKRPTPPTHTIPSIRKAAPPPDAMLAHVCVVKEVQVLLFVLLIDTRTHKIYGTHLVYLFVARAGVLLTVQRYGSLPMKSTHLPSL